MRCARGGPRRRGGRGRCGDLTAVAARDVYDHRAFVRFERHVPQLQFGAGARDVYPRDSVPVNKTRRQSNCPYGNRNKRTKVSHQRLGVTRV